MSITNIKNKIEISIIIPTYNEARVICECIGSLLKQDADDFEIIVIDDGSTDKTFSVVKELQNNWKSPQINLKIFKQRHKRAGAARNLGAKKADGRILVFVDADMTFEKDFLAKLVKPIKNKLAIGTNSQQEYLANPDNIWALCWNIGKFAAAGNFTDNYKTSMIPDKSNKGGVFRAILKKSFESVRGYEKSGDYTDDTSLAFKLRSFAVETDAKFYHKNPQTFSEIWSRAGWIGSGRNFTRDFSTKAISLLKFSPPVAFLKGMAIATRLNFPIFVIFKMVYDLAIWWSVIKSLFKYENRHS